MATINTAQSIWFNRTTGAGGCYMPTPASDRQSQPPNNETRLKDIIQKLMQSFPVESNDTIDTAIPAHGAISAKVVKNNPFVAQDNVKVNNGGAHGGNTQPVKNAKDEPVDDAVIVVPRNGKQTHTKPQVDEGVTPVKPPPTAEELAAAWKAKEKAKADAAAAAAKLAADQKNNCNDFANDMYKYMNQYPWMFGGSAGGQVGDKLNPGEAMAIYMKHNKINNMSMKECADKYGPEAGAAIFKLQPCELAKGNTPDWKSFEAGARLLTDGKMPWLGR